jgi:dTDP-4-amino-4,6-dideoxygalactose transaminase
MNEYRAAMKRIYLSPPHLDGREKQLVLEALESNWITTLGPQVEALEREICEKTSVAHGVALSSGTAALHLALQVLGVGRGDVVLCSDLTFAASANAISYLGAEPVFVDSDLATWNMDPLILEEAIRSLEASGRHPKAVVVVDLYGQCADFGRISSMCHTHGIPIVEDAAEALGAACGERAAGSLGALGVFSFNGNKIITTSGGGMLLSNNKAYIDRARFLATQARDPAPYYQHSTIGYNYRLSNLLAALGRAQLETLARKVARRREINRHYRDALRTLPGIDFMPHAAFGQPNCWLTCVTVDPAAFGCTNNDIREHLERHNIESRLLWKPMHMQPVYAQCRVFGGRVSEVLFDRGLCLPSGSSLSNEDLDEVCRLISDTHR